MAPGHILVLVRLQAAYAHVIHERIYAPEILLRAVVHASELLRSPLSLISLTAGCCCRLIAAGTCPCAWRGYHSRLLGRLPRQRGQRAHGRLEQTKVGCTVRHSVSCGCLDNEF